MNFINGIRLLVHLSMAKEALPPDEWMVGEYTNNIRNLQMLDVQN
jgi:hypothetical protein